MRRRIAAALAVMFSMLAAGSAPAAAQDTTKILVFSKVTNFRHESIPYGIAAIQQMGEQQGWDVVATDDSTVFNDTDLATFDAVVFNNTNSIPGSGDLLNAEQREAFKRYIQRGGGFAGLHAATAAERDWAWYEGLVGSIFTNHPPGRNPDGTIDGRVKVTDRHHPSTKDLPELWEFEEEWYNFRQRLIGDVHVLAWIDTGVGIQGLQMGPDHPFAWCHAYDGGRSWYTAGGHSPAAFSDPEFLSHLKGGIAYAAGVAPGECGATVEDSFNKVQIADNTADPMALDFLPGDEVVFIERGGAVKVIDQGTLDVTTAGTIPVYTPDSDGLLGVAVDPDFAQNRWIYVTYSHATQSQLNVSRFTLTPELRLEDERVLLEIPTFRGLDRANVHMGGAMDFDAEGNLYIATGDNVDPFASDGYAPIDERPGRAHFDAQGTSANTADLRGKVIRITPTDDGGYAIPSGNLFAPGTEGARPEIYAMGFRNPFRFKVDPATGDVLLAEHSPDATANNATRGPRAHGEWNVIKQAGNYGWPYCIGPNVAYNDYDFATAQSGAPFDCAAPVNDSPNNTGLRALPPVQRATIWENYGGTPAWPELGTGPGIAPGGGPVYRYDPALESDTKFPPYYDGKWFTYEWESRWIKPVSFLTADYPGERYPAARAGDVLSIDPWGIDKTWVRPMDIDFGPDGALYVIEWGSNFGGNLRGQPNDDSGIYRIDYVAGNRPPVAEASADVTDGQAPLTVRFSSAGTGHPDGNPITLQWEFGDGTTSSEPNPTHTYTENGEYTARLTVTDDEERVARAVVRIVVGNTRPVVRLKTPANGGFFEFGDSVPYTIEVEDAEDGSTADGGVDCEDVELQTLLGHNDHAHPLQRFSGCSGTVPTLTDGGHGEDQNLYYILEAIYVDSGGEGTGTLTGAGAARLRTKFTEAEHADASGGVTTLARPSASGGARLGEIRPGDWAAFDPVSLHGIHSVTLGASSAGQGGHVELRRGGVDGELLGSVEVEPTASWEDVQELELDLADPGGTFPLYLVFRAADGYTPSGPDLLSLDWLEFHGPGVTDDASPTVQVSAEPTAGPAPLPVSFSGSATSPEGHPITSYAWDFGDGATGSGSAVTHTYGSPGTYRAVLTATDSEGNEGTRAVTITVTEPEQPVCPGVRSDEFEGGALDRDRWTRIVREDAGRMSVGGGALTLPTVAGRIYSTQNNDGANIVLQPMPDGAWEATTRLTVDAGVQFQKAGIIVYGDDDNYARANVVGLGTPPAGAPSRKFEFIRESGGVPRNASGQDDTAPLPADFPRTVYLRVASDGESLTAAYSGDGETWQPFGRPAPLAGIEDPHIGLISNKSHTSAPVVDAAFDWFRVSPDEAAERPAPDDEFDGGMLDPCRWDRVVRPVPGAYSVSDGRLRVRTTSGGNFGANNGPPVENQFLQSVAPDEDWVIETKVDAPLDHRFQQAGLQYYEDDGTYVKLDLVADNAPGAARALRVELRSEIGDVPQQPQPDLRPAPANAGNEWWLRLAKRGDRFIGSVSTDGSQWVQMPGTVMNGAIDDGAYGLLHQGRTQQQPVTLGFDHFRVIPTVSATLSPAEPDGEAGWYRSPVTLTASSTAPVEYRIGAGDWAAYDGPVVLSEDGRHTVEVRAGHSDVSRFEVPLDTTPPEVTVGGVRDAGDSEELALAVSAADALSGTGDMSVTLDGEPVAPDARVPLYTLPLGAHEVVVAARDAAGNLTRRAVPFTTHTSFADMQALMDAFEAAGRFGGPRTEVIRQTFASAVAHADAGRPDAAISALERYDRHVRSDHRVPDAEVAAVLSRDAEEMIRRLAPSPAR